MPATPVHHTDVDKDGAWDGPAEEKKFDKKAADFDKFYAWVDKGSSDSNADGTDKEDGWGPHHDCNADGIPAAANLKGVESAMSAINGAHGGKSVIPDADRQGVWDHLAAHYEDAGTDPKDIPELKSAQARSTVRKPRSQRQLAQMPEFRLRTGILEVRSSKPSTSGLIEVNGVVIVYDTPYEVLDMFGSFTETIHYGAATALLASADLDVRFLFNHADMPLSRTGATCELTLVDAPEGLNVTALIDPRMSPANDLIVAIEQGLITQMSVGMQVDPAGDVWSGEDDWGMPNVRDIYRLSNIFDTSAVTYPASPTTSVELASRMWEQVPVQSRERTRKLWSIAREARQGRVLSQADADALMHSLEQLYTADTATGVRAAPTKQDAKVTTLLGNAHDAVNAVVQAQMQDPDNGTDPADAEVWKQIQAAQTALTLAAKAQGKDNAPAEPPETKETYQGDPDGTEGNAGGDAPVPDNEDGTGSRSLSIDIDLDLARLRRR